jgi:hypothetical protein
MLLESLEDFEYKLSVVESINELRKMRNENTWVQLPTIKPGTCVLEGSRSKMVVTQSELKETELLSLYPRSAL